MNGKHYRSYSQGARREKESSDKKEGSNEQDGMEGDKQVTVSQKEDGGYHVKHSDGSEDTHHEDKQEMLDHVDQHFGGAEDESKESDDESMGDLDGAVKSLLG